MNILLFIESGKGLGCLQGDCSRHVDQRPEGPEFVLVLARKRQHILMTAAETCWGHPIAALECLEVKKYNARLFFSIALHLLFLKRDEALPHWKIIGPIVIVLASNRNVTNNLGHLARYQHARFWTNAEQLTCTSRYMCGYVSVHFFIYMYDVVRPHILGKFWWRAAGCKRTDEWTDIRIGHIGLWMVCIFFSFSASRGCLNATL